MSKKLLGVVFILLAIILTLALIAALPQIVDTSFEFIGVLSGNKDAYDAGYVMGKLLGWGLQVCIAFLLWKYGLRWVKKSSQSTDAGQTGEQG